MSSTLNNTLNRTEQREAEILDAAMNMFAEEGYHAVSTRKIAKRAGVSEGTLFNYFGAKHELMSGLLRAIYAELTENAQAVFRDISDTRARLDALALNHITVMSRDNALFMRLIQSYMNVDISGYTEIRQSVLHELNISYAWVFDFAVKEGMQRGEVREDINISALRDLFFGGLEYGSRSLFLHDAFDQCEERVASLVDPLWQSMRRDADPRAPENASKLDAVCERLESVATQLEKLPT
ncbi:MAG: TetR/AcrR family transcriptional regulator [Pseudomonadota bacterium]